VNFIRTFNSFCISDVQLLKRDRNFVRSRFYTNECAFVRYVVCNFIRKSHEKVRDFFSLESGNPVIIYMWSRGVFYSGQTAAEAEANFLVRACQLDTYGVDPHPVKVAVTTNVSY